LWIFPGFDAFSGWSAYGKHQIRGFFRVLMLFSGGAITESIRFVDFAEF